MNLFTPRAQQVLALSRRESDRLNHPYVGTEHLLLGLTRLTQARGINALQKLGLDLETVRIEVEKQIGSGPEARISGSIPYTPRVKKVLALAGKEAKALNHSYVGTEHILLGLLREGDGVAARVLTTMGCDIERVRVIIVEESASSGPIRYSALSEVRKTSQLDDMSKKLDAMMDMLGRLKLEVSELRLALPKETA
jgi:ATP-dependent Clp protease ATP-binding subunit ClpC